MPRLKIDIVSLFPNFFSSPLSESLLKKALERKILQINIHNLRDFSPLPNKSVDDAPYGGGAGMVLRPEPISIAIKKLRKTGSKVILLDPSGKKFNQKIAKQLSKEKHLILVCGRYEGVDERIKESYIDEEISIGDFIINGGETAALVVLEAVGRLVEGVLGNKASLSEESFNAGLLEYPQYTRPEVFEGKKVPEILLSGNHEKIRLWRKEKARAKTKKVRPDLLV
jgi:tRNA (guanine37-N1)-methyltransferase